MKQYTVDIPIAGWISVVIESDLENAEDVLAAIRNDDIDVPVSLDDVQNWTPVLDTNNINWESFEAPTEIMVF